MQATSFGIVWAAVVGACVGSFVGVVLYRVPRGLPLTGRSACATCNTPIPAWVNVPVFAWLLLRGRARCCNAHIPASVLLPEVATAAAWAGCAWAFPVPLAALAAVAITTLTTPLMARTARKALRPTSTHL